MILATVVAVIGGLLAIRYALIPCLNAVDGYSAI